MNRIDKHKNDCCGCTACMSICPKNAIKMRPDALGFMYPAVDDSACINCGLCLKVCQFKKDYDVFEVHEPALYAFRNKDEKQLMRSQSGAAFWTLAQQFITDGGIVFGVGYDENFRAVHKSARTVEDLEEMRGSKYVQSDVASTFNEAEDWLDRGNKVLFSGTPCQIAGLKSYAGERLRKNLYTIDLVCHGVPSPYIWRDYLRFIKKKFKAPLTGVNFRDKSKGWDVNIPSFRFGKKFVYNTDYARFFYSDIMLRENCYECPYTNFRRAADITIADFWGWTRLSKEFNDNKGVSLLMVNSDKGRQLLDSVKDVCHLRETCKEACMQRNLKESTHRNPLRPDFEKDYKANGFDYVAKKYLGMGLKDTFIRSFKSIVKNITGRK